MTNKWKRLQQKQIAKVQEWINKGYDLETCRKGAWNKYSFSYAVKGDTLHLFARDYKFKEYKVAELTKQGDNQ